MRWILAAVGLLAIALLSETWYQTHYAAPAASLVFLLTVQGLRRLATTRVRMWRPGAALLALILGGWLVTLPASLETNHESFSAAMRGMREPLLTRLGNEPGSHLVVVQDPPVFQHAGWINNEADIDASRIVWARDRGPVKNEALLRYYQGRRIWYLAIDQQPPLLKPYSRD
jgi:hypothetical protein